MKIVMRFPKIQFCPFSKFSNTGNDTKASSSSFVLCLESPKAGDKNIVAKTLFITHKWDRFVTLKLFFPHQRERF